jgi:hypothetical protein
VGDALGRSVHMLHRRLRKSYQKRQIRVSGRNRPVLRPRAAGVR